MSRIVNMKTKTALCQCGDIIEARDCDGKTIHSGDEVYLETKAGKAVGYFPVVVEEGVAKLYGSRYTLGRKSNIKLGSLLRITKKYSDFSSGEQIYKNLQLD